MRALRKIRSKLRLPRLRRPRLGFPKFKLLKISLPKIALHKFRLPNLKSSPKTKKTKTISVQGGFSLFNKKEKTSHALARCAAGKHVSFHNSGSSRVMQVRCEGCPFSSQALASDKCKLAVAKNMTLNRCDTLILDDGFYKREYDHQSTAGLQELAEIADSIQFHPGDGCGSCGAELKAFSDKIRTEIILDPVAFSRKRYELAKNPDVSVKGVDAATCEHCLSSLNSSMMRACERTRRSNFIQLMDGITIGDRKIFTPGLRPFFSNSRIVLEPPLGATQINQYSHLGSEVAIYTGRDGEELYHIAPLEYKLTDEQLKVMKQVYLELTKQGPDLFNKVRGDDVERQFFLICKKKVDEISKKLRINLGEEEIPFISRILTRSSLGLDIIEVLLQDENLQDVYVNSPVDRMPIYVKHKDFDDCRTNIFLTEQATQAIISKFRLQSGRAFSEVSPILDMEIPKFGVRVNITGPPISPDGVAFAFRRAREIPWTLLRFIHNKMISPEAAGLLAFLVNEESSILMCGDRGSGKTSMLSALVASMPTKYRILTMEDTFEIPVAPLVNEGFRIQRMRVKSATATQESFELSTDQAMRSLLRMGDSAIVMGEVRGEEARTLYEAMNVGGSGNCVLGTIHGKSPQGLLERVIYSLGVPPQSFKATDIVVLANRIRPKGGSKKYRRVAQIVEVTKNWAEPKAEDVFKALMVYDPDSDSLQPTKELTDPRKSDVLSKIARRRGVPPARIFEDIRTRSRVYRAVVDAYGLYGDEALLELKTMVDVNKAYTYCIDKVLKELGEVDYTAVFSEWSVWFERYTAAYAPPVETADKPDKPDEPNEPDEPEKEKWTTSRSAASQVSC